MEQMIAALIAQLQGLGLAGLLIGLLVAASYYFLTQWQASQDARIAEGKEAVKAITATEAALDRLVDVLKARRDA
jgi:hypothetical protein